MKTKPEHIIYKIAFATGSRADYGIVRRYLSLLNRNDDIALDVLATGALMDEQYGRAVDLVEQDGFHIAHAFRTPIQVGTTAETLHIMAAVQDDFGRYFQAHRYQLLILLGDRYEILSVAIAAAMQRIPILHLHGGEITLANYDEFIRHAITKMSTWHITSTPVYRHRVIQLGEHPDRVWCLGALGAENCLHIQMKHVPEELRHPVDTFCVLFHPETLAPVQPAEQIEEVLQALEPFVDHYRFVCLGNNADTHSDQIATRVQAFCDAHAATCTYYANLHPDAYHHLLRHSIALIGNSSSGIIEAPSLGTFTVNIGNRQTGRVKGRSVIDTPCQRADIIRSLHYVLAHRGEPVTDTPYYRPGTAQAYYETTLRILQQGAPADYKRFYDIDF
jgi:UDP-N-acetylglucosamine 2-epimerase (non-hydrolysing)